jgi:phage tail-like protein
MSMRTGIAHLATPHALGERLPGVYLDDEFTMRLTEAFDEVLAPVMVTLDCFADYLDPRLAPEDFVEWLAGWVAFAIDESWSGAQRRELIAQAVQLHRWRGTKRGLVAHVRQLTGGEVDIADSGVCAWSDRPGGPVPGSDPPRVVVLVRVPDPTTIDQRRLYAAIAELVPAHVLVTVEIVPAG